MPTNRPPLEGAPVRGFHHADFPAERILAAKGSTTVSVCIPARNEAATVGAVVGEVRRSVVDAGLADEIVVIDDHSTDDTAPLAAAAGATVVHAGDILPEYGHGPGKGEALWKSVFVSSGDVVVWCDADITDFDAALVTGLIGPLVCHPELEFVKGHYDRPAVAGQGGGRVTELVARPLLSLFFPALSGLIQPLSGEYGGRRSILEQLPFVEGYGVEVGLLLDLLRLRGTAVLAQSDLGRRVHRSRDLRDLGPQAMAITQTILRRADRQLVPAVAELIRPGTDTVTVDVSERPPLVEVADYISLLRREGGAVLDPDEALDGIRLTRD